MVFAFKVYLVKPSRSLSGTDIDQHLRPADAKVFNVLRIAAERHPGSYLSMSEIANLAFGQRDRSSAQVKNLIQRSIYEIRQKFGRDVVLSRGAQYRLQVEAPEAPVVLPAVEEQAVKWQAGRWGQFGSRICELLRLAQGEKGATLSRLVLFGDDAVNCVSDFPDELQAVLRVFRAVQFFCPDLRVVVHCLDRLSSGGPSSLDLREYAGLLKIVVTPVPGIAGVAWIDQFEGQSFVELGTPTSSPLRVVSGAAAHRFLVHYDARLAMLSGDGSPSAQPLRIDRFDLPTQRSFEELRDFLRMRRIRKDDGRVIPFINEILG